MNSSQTACRALRRAAPGIIPRSSLADNLRHPPFSRAWYAVGAKKPRPLRVPRTKLRPAPAQSQLQHDGSESDFMPRSQEEFHQAVVDESIETVDAKEAHRICCAYHEAEVRNQKSVDSKWERDFLANNNIKASTLHEIAYISLSLNKGQYSDKEGRFAMRMLDTAGALGYQPATLTLAFRALISGKIRDLKDYWPRVDARLKHIVDEGRSANAFVCQGLLLANRGDDENAVAAWKRALQLDEDGAEGNCTLDWRSACLHHLGLAYKRQGETSLAREALSKAASLDNVDSCYELAALDSTEPRAVWLLTRAAMSGHRLAPAKLAELETESRKEALERGDGKAAAKHLQDAMEWSSIARAWTAHDPLDKTVY